MECDQAFSTVNIEDSRSMQALTKATMRDSAAMKQVSMNFHNDLWFVILTGGRQISYLTMIFLPASYLSVSYPFHQPPSMTHGYVDRAYSE
jgi:hypothetical protein